jgi:hypothetical protein
MVGFAALYPLLMLQPGRDKEEAITTKPQTIR